MRFSPVFCRRRCKGLSLTFRLFHFFYLYLHRTHIALFLSLSSLLFLLLLFLSTLCVDRCGISSGRAAFITLDFRPRGAWVEVLTLRLITLTLKRISLLFLLSPSHSLFLIFCHSVSPSRSSVSPLFSPILLLYLSLSHSLTLSLSLSHSLPLPLSFLPLQSSVEPARLNFTFTHRHTADTSLHAERLTLPMWEEAQILY